MNYPKDLYYTSSHEWVRVDGEVATVGITDFAQDALGDVVFFDAPDVGDEVEQGDVLGEVESVKAVSDVYVAVSGEVVEINEALDDEPELVNSDPYGGGWMVKIRLTDQSQLSSLMNAQAPEAADG